MLARLDGRVVLVAGALPGERVRASISRRTGKVIWAETNSVLEPSPDRREPPTDARCGGALYSHIKYERQLQLKSEVIKDAFRRIGKHELQDDIAVAPSPETGYRVRARLHIQGHRMGFLLEGTHVLCDAAATRQLAPGAIEAIERLREVLGPAFATCASIQVAEAVAGQGRVALCELRSNADPGAFAGVSLPSGLTGVAVLTDRGMFTAAGEDRIVDQAGELLGSEGPQWSRRSASFFQGNRFLVGPLLQRVLALAQGDTFADLYSGIGLFAVALAARGATGFAVEGDVTSGEDLTANAAQVQDRLTVRHEPVEVTTTGRLRQPVDVVVVDPPRTGLSSAVAEGLLRWATPKIVYVSCDVPTLARDTALFIAGGYRLASLEAFDMFPGTPHVECVAVLALAAGSIPLVAG